MRTKQLIVVMCLFFSTICVGQKAQSESEQELHNQLQKIKEKVCKYDKCTYISLNAPNQCRNIIVSFMDSDNQDASRLFVQVPYSGIQTDITWRKTDPLLGIKYSDNGKPKILKKEALESLLSLVESEFSKRKL